MMPTRNMYQCEHRSSAPEDLVAHLPKSQAGAGRHKCAVCAYAEGYRDALAGGAAASPLATCRHRNRAPNDLLTRLPESQAGPDRERHKCCVCAYALGAADGGMAFSFPDDVSDSDRPREGAVKTVTVNGYERNPLARQRCIEKFGYTCSVCGFDFEARYGAAGRGLIHVHHLRPLAGVGREYRVDPINDLRPICPNCHAMIHRRDPPYTVEQIRAMLRSNT